MTKNENIALMIKVEQLGLLKQALGCSYSEASDLFDRYNIWEFVDDAYYGLHVQGAQATFEDIRTYIQNKESQAAQ